ncbi:hypothetical protein LTR05_007470 [Lithohypha guttulata]|uniref:Beta-galactosidase n=1 Tax=Lithohypha guttulata TaxID=1690604 RepID=A0AAN7SW38_9EURO|nr:hypothetical protein LTR05_007470 [Lithohypha guttulata]
MLFAVAIKTVAESPDTVEPTYLRPTRTSQQLMVGGNPFLMLAGQMHNSSFSSAEYMSKMWPKIESMNINTVLGSVTWQMIEPTEGNFDFSELDQIILDSREHSLHLVLLWFGSFKSATSTYVPDWVKQDVKRFPRVHILGDNGKLKTVDLLSPFNVEACRADAKAFAALMRHIKEIDSQYSTVLMVQVENECGMLGDSRDRSYVATDSFESTVPEDLLKYLTTETELHPMFRKRWPYLKQALEHCENTSWESVFGYGVATEELFMADVFARYVAWVLTAGKREYDIPMYTNCWLSPDGLSTLDLNTITKGRSTSAVAGGSHKVGAYPSGGPVPHLLDIWYMHTIDKGHLDFISPNLYLHDYGWICKQYSYKKRPLFIPEQRADNAGARRAWLSYGSYSCIGCSPFGIDTVLSSEADRKIWQHTYGLLHRLSSHILEAQAQRPESMFGFFFDEFDSRNVHEEWRYTFSDIALEVVVERAFVLGTPAPGYGLVIHRGEGKLLLAGAGFQVSFKSTNPRATFTGIVSAAEKEIDEDGTLRTARVLNGDEIASGRSMVMPSEQPDHGGFPMKITVPARTYVAEVVAYSLEEDEEDI